MCTVTTFAKKTGDYPSLSHVDLKLMALTYQLECELGPEKGANLREEPQRTVSDLKMGHFQSASRVIIIIYMYMYKMYIICDLLQD